MVKAKMIGFLLFGIGFLFISVLQFKYGKTAPAVVSLIFAAIDFLVVYLFFKRMPKS